MKKNIVVLVKEVSSDYSLGVLTGIINYYEHKDVNLIIIPVRNPYENNNNLDNQYWIGMRMISAQDIDAIIILTPIFSSSMSIEQLHDYLKDVKCKNIVSLSIPLNIPGCVNTKISCQPAYDTIIQHLKEEHNCNKIAFMSANATGSKEALDRYNAFINSMKKNNLEFDEKNKFEGYFVYIDSFNTLKEKYKSKNEVDFDALVCANDMMAFGAIDYLSSLGLKIPEDIKIIGYDDVDQAQIAELSLSTINQQINLQGETAAELAYKMANGEQVPKETTIDIKPIFRRSCGCESNIKDTDLYKKMMTSSNGAVNTTLYQYIRSNMDLQKIYFLLETMSEEQTLESLFKAFKDILPKEIISGITVCLYSKPVYVTTMDTCVLPNEVSVVLHIDKNNEVYETHLDNKFKPKKEIVPEKYLKNSSGAYMVHPIFFGTKQFGYFLCKLESKSLVYDMIYEKVFSDIIAQAYIYTKQLEETAKLTSENIMLQLSNSELSEKSKTDVLTNIFNRRGFLDAGQDAINLTIKMNMEGLVCFGDMDNLKFINDTYGHEMGDRAIQTQAEILKTVFRKNDVLGRLGGDEFAAVLTGLDLDTFENIKAKIEKVSKAYSKKNGLPFEISISVGAIEFSPEDHDINILLKKADELQYIEKRRKHAERK